jgi:hypothetical protein
MSISNNRVSAHWKDQAFKFLIRRDSVTKATVTLHAEDLDVAWIQLHALFPGSDLSDTEVQHAGRHSLKEGL